MLPNNDFKAVCSVTELAKKLGLSRARFYQLQKLGVFPVPVYCLHTKRPFYPMDSQETCLDIRRTGIGHNGRPILFYSKRDGSSSRPKSCLEQKYIMLSEGLEQVGLKISPAKAEKVFKALYPDNWKKREFDGTVIVEASRHLQNAV